VSGVAVRVLGKLAECSDPDAASDHTIQFGHRLLARDRLREPVYRALMRLLLRKGERTEALKLYAACRSALSAELGVSPEAKTEELYRDIITDRLDLSPATPEAART